MEILLQTPAIIKIIVSLLFLLIINRVTKNLVISVLLGTLLLALWSGHPLTAIGEITWARISSMNTIFLLIIIFLVIWFSTQMAETGVMKEMVTIVKCGVSKRYAMAMLPAIIGLLPMPGGALFSAPLVDDCDTEKSLKPRLKAKINYWFRHVWEYWWPLYPGVILAIDLSGLSIWQFILLQLPLSILSVCAGFIFLLRKIKKQQPENGRKEKHIVPRFLKIIFPVMIVILVYTSVRIFFTPVAAWNQYLPMCIGIICAMIVLQLLRPLSLKQWLNVILSKKTIFLALLVAAVRVYGAFIEARLPGGMLLVETMRAELDAIGIPLLVIIIIIPFISGMASGLAIGFVGASFPIVVNIIGMNPTMGALFSSVLIAYAAGYMGMILSPVHVCFIVTNEYFKTELLRSLIELIKPAIVVLTGAFFIYILIRIIFP
jgi:integral membrane protein (TIGR00529 family)